MLSTKKSNNAKSRSAGKNTKKSKSAKITSPVVNSNKNIFVHVLTWLDSNILTALTAILIVMIPLYPKIPLAELIQGYIVRLRLEDLLVLFTFVVWFIQVIRRKAKLPSDALGKAIGAYLIVGFLSTVSAIYVTHTVPMEKAHLLKIAFHWVRRIEYFSLFFITYSAIKSKKDLILFAKIALATLIGTVIYGIGQKYFYFPAFSTMNREFSKGVRLYLQPNTRLFSTFAGHYDFAAYLMTGLCFTIPLAWMTVKKWMKVLLYTVSAFAYWCLVLTTSRTSFVGYLAGITVIAALLLKKYGWKWVFKRWFVTMTVSMMIMFSFSNLLERFTQVIPNQDTRERILAFQKVVNQPFVHEPEGSQTVSELPSLLAFIFKNEKPKEIIMSDEEKTQLQIVASGSDMPPSPVKPTPTPTPTPNPELPSDVTQESENIRKETAANAGQTYNGPSYSENALKYGLSMGIRLDVLWPQAIKGFMRNPLLGSGYSTLVKSNNDEFTYAESTDNDYLRMLGETGALGFLTFMAVIYLFGRYAYELIKSPEDKITWIGVGAVGAIVGMLLTATYIDIFESSKVAYTFWMVMAAVAYYYDQKVKNAKA
jgi:hypothetical protein